MPERARHRNEYRVQTVKVTSSAERDASTETQDCDASSSLLCFVGRQVAADGLLVAEIARSVSVLCSEPSRDIYE
jgi:hypothetical protein